MNGSDQTPVSVAVPRRRIGAIAGVMGAGLAAGAILAGSHVAGAASNSGSTSTGSTGSAATANATANAGRPDPATMNHGPGETLLTGGNLTKAMAAAKAAVPGATVIRAETDADGGAVYVVHMRKADGSYVTVELDKSFKVTGTEDGFGPGHGFGAPNTGTASN